MDIQKSKKKKIALLKALSSVHHLQTTQSMHSLPPDQLLETVTVAYHAGFY